MWYASDQVWICDITQIKYIQMLINFPINSLKWDKLVSTVKYIFNKMVQQKGLSHNQRNFVNSIKCTPVLINHPHLMRKQEDDSNLTGPYQYIYYLSYILFILGGWWIIFLFTSRFFIYFHMN